MATRRNAQNKAIPLCLPNNCQWNAATGEYIKTGERRSSLYVVEEALQKLRTVTGKKILIEIIASLLENAICDRESTLSTDFRFCRLVLTLKRSKSGAPKETHELIFSWLLWLAVLLVGAYTRRRRSGAR